MIWFFVLCGVVCECVFGRVVVVWSWGVVGMGLVCFWFGCGSGFYFGLWCFLFWLYVIVSGGV